MILEEFGSRRRRNYRMNGSRRLEMYTSDEKVGLAKDLMRAFNVAWIVVSVISVPMIMINRYDPIYIVR